VQCLTIFTTFYDISNQRSVIRLPYAHPTCKDLDEIKCYQKLFNVSVATENIPYPWEIVPTYANLDYNPPGIYYSFSKSNCSVVETIKMDIGSLMQLKYDGQNVVNVTDDGFSFKYYFKIFITQAYSHDPIKGGNLDKMVNILSITLTVPMSSNSSTTHGKYQVNIDARFDSNYIIYSNLYFESATNSRVLTDSCKMLTPDFLIDPQTYVSWIIVKSTKPYRVESPPKLSLECQTWNGTHYQTPVQFLLLDYTGGFHTNTSNGTIIPTTTTYISNTSDPYLHPLPDKGDIGGGGKQTLAHVDYFIGTDKMIVKIKYLKFKCLDKCYNNEKIEVQLINDDDYGCMPLTRSNISKTICDLYFSPQKINCQAGKTNGKCTLIGTIFPVTFGGYWGFEAMYSFKNSPPVKADSDGGLKETKPPFPDANVDSTFSFNLV